MKFSEKWLRSFADPPLHTKALAAALTFAGLEVEEVEAIAPAFQKVVVGHVLSVEKHANADKLSVCQVDVGGPPLTIVCGAPNVHAGMNAPTALIGAKLPEIEIRATKVRGVESQGMLCSAKELGLSSDAAGLMALAPDAPVGASIRDVLELGDCVFTTKPTPNRGDCLSILGVAREVAAITGAVLTPPQLFVIEPVCHDKLEVTLEAPVECPLYCGRLIRGVSSQAQPPAWMTRRLERSGVRTISAIVDITNYVMLELGQPLHAFDADRIEGGIHVRRARASEKLELLNGQTPELDATYLVIADDAKALALAGIMGGAQSSVRDETRNIFLESAFFTPEVIAGRSRQLGFGSDSSFRFERGVDFDQTRAALDRAASLVLEICGGEPGPVSEARATLPRRAPVTVRLERAERVLGLTLGRSEAEDILRRLRLPFEQSDGAYRVTPPAYRFDLAIEEDLIEELARVYGYDRIPAAAPVARVSMLPASEDTRSRPLMHARLVAREYHEVVTYSFIDRRWEEDLCGNLAPIALANPIASHMNVMRSSLIPGLLMTVAFNARHRQERVRLFEIGRCFERVGENLEQPMRLACMAYGDASEEQWAAARRPTDFYDVKGDLESLLAPAVFEVESAEHPALHPGKCGRVVVAGRRVGWMGEIHPQWQQRYELPRPPIVFEIAYDAAAAAIRPLSAAIAKVPPVRRDIAAIFDADVRHAAVIDVLRRDAPPVVADVRLFDVYRGSDLGKAKKSLAFMVLLQDTRKTLTDAEVESALSALRETLRKHFDAKLR